MTEIKQKPEAEPAKGVNESTGNKAKPVAGDPQKADARVDTNMHPKIEKLDQYKTESADMDEKEAPFMKSELLDE